MKFGLLEEITDATPYINSDEWAMEEKLDGMRLQIKKTGNVVTAWTRQGIEWTLPESVKALALSYGRSFHVDGELIGDEFAAFDLLEFAGIPTGHIENKLRKNGLQELPFLPVYRAESKLEKKELLDYLKRNDGEGVVFKRKNAPYVDGRAYGFKFKFYRTETFRVVSVDIAKASCEIERGGRSCGRVRFCVNGDWPKVGDLCEVRFDSVTKAGKLTRPIWKGLRVDLGPEAVSAPLVS